MKLYAPFITRFIVGTSNDCDFRQYPDLQTFIICDRNKFTSSSELLNDIFSNRFPSLHHSNLGQINNLINCVWSTSPSLRFISVRSNEPLVVLCIFASCSNLDHLQVHVLSKMTKETRIGDLTSVHQLHSCFNRIECIKEEDNFRIFTTKYKENDNLLIALNIIDL
jgi:hypothetical protein